MRIDRLSSLGAALFAWTGLAQFPAAQAALTTDGSDWSPYVVWSIEDPGGTQTWSPWALSLGNAGTQVFCFRSNYVTGPMLLSAHDGSPPVPVWSYDMHPEDPLVFLGQGADSAVTTDIHASLSRLETGTLDDFIVSLRLYRSGGLLWTYTYPQITGGRYGMDVSRDGQTIVAAIPNHATGGNDLLVFGPGSNQPQHVWSLPGGTIWSMDMAEEAPRVVLGLETTVVIVDTETGGTILSVSSGVSLSSNTLVLSADARYFGHPFSGNWRIETWNGLAYVPYLDQPLPPGGIVSAAAFSRDDSTCAYGISFPYPSTVVHTQCLDLPTKQLTLSESIASAGGDQNTCLDIAISDDGRIVAEALAGDQFGEQAEFRLYANTGNGLVTAPLFTLDFPGSALNVDVSPDGRWVVVGSRDTHINELGAGGRIDLVALDDTGLSIEGVPHVAGEGRAVLRAEPGQEADVGWLLYGLHLLDPPLALPGGGSLAIDPAQLDLVPLGHIGSDLEASLHYRLPDDPALVGFTVFLQALRLDGQGFKSTSNTLPLTILPG